MADLLTQQYTFTAHLRDARQPAPPDINPRRMALYRELFFNNIEGFLSNNFPLLRTYYDDATWQNLAQDFFARHRCLTPYFYAIPQEFIQYLQNERAPQSEDPPFLYDLAHYEWIETALAIAPGEPPPRLIELDQPLTWSELAQILTYQWPIQDISAGECPDRPEPVCLLGYRGYDDQVHFLQLNPLTEQLVRAIQAQPGQTAADYLNRLLKTLDYANPEGLLRGGFSILADLAERGVIGRN